MRYVAPCVPTRNQDRRQVATQSRRSCLRAPPHPIPHFLLSSFAAAVAVAWRVVPSFLLPGRCRLRSPLIRCIIGASFIGASLVDKSPPHRNAPSEARRHYCTRPLLSGFIGTRPIYLAVTTRPIYWLSLISGSAHSAMAAAALEHRMIQADTLIQDRRYRRTLTHTGRRDASGRSEQYPHTL